MARYFFHVVNGHMVVDQNGMECATIEDARAQAIRAAGEMLRELDTRNWPIGRWYMFVTDEGNKTRFRLAFEVEELAQDAAPGIAR